MAFSRGSWAKTTFRTGGKLFNKWTSTQVTDNTNQQYITTPITPADFDISKPAAFVFNAAGLTTIDSGVNDSNSRIYACWDRDAYATGGATLGLSGNIALCATDTNDADAAMQVYNWIPGAVAGHVPCAGLVLSLETASTLDAASTSVKTIIIQEAGELQQ